VRGKVKGERDRQKKSDINTNRQRQKLTESERIIVREAVRVREGER